MCTAPALLSLASQSVMEGFQQSTDVGKAYFGTAWDVLGPFSIGTREWQWSADPLETYGGFHALEYDTNTSYPSSLAEGGKVYWSPTIGQADGRNQSANTDLEFAFQNVDWDFLRTVYGWPAMQYSAWARGTFYVSNEHQSSGKYMLNTDHVVEVWIDEDYYFGGDFYGFQRAPLLLTLSPGEHLIEIRLIHEVRSMGGIGDPITNIRLQLEPVEDVFTEMSKALVPDVVNGSLAGPYASIAVRNTGDELQQVLAIESMKGDVSASLVHPERLLLQPGQIRQIAIGLGLHDPDCRTAQLRITVKFLSSGDLRQYFSHIRFEHRNIDDMHRMTYMHPSGFVSYSMIRPPPPTSHTATHKRLPVLVGLHGAGVDADSEMWAHSFDDVADLHAWTVLPSGVTSWCGDDFHQWGWVDAEAALAAIPVWISQTGWIGPLPDTDRLLIAGHSNGGQGAWYALLHHPDRIIAAVIASGYASIQKYVPYSFWYETDPRRTAIIQATLNSYRHELMLENAKGTSVFVQHGSADDNVPVLHARRMVQLANESGVSVQYTERRGEGHWHDGIMTTEPLKQYYRQQLRKDSSRDNELKFDIIVANPADTGSVHGVKIEQLADPGQLGRLRANLTHSQQAHIVTSNIDAFSLTASLITGKTLQINQQIVHYHVSQDGYVNFTMDDMGSWSEQTSEITGSNRLRRQKNQLGNMDALLRSEGRFTIISHDPTTLAVATQISLNFYQYLAADTSIITAPVPDRPVTGNIISVGIGLHVTELPDGFPIVLGPSSIELLGPDHSIRYYDSKTHGLAAIFLSPLDDDRLELMVWGADLPSLQVAARLVPMISGAGQPDFVIMTREMLWKGAGGVLAMGFFDSVWGITKSSFLL